MYGAELNISGRVFEVSWIEVDKQVSRSIGISHSKAFRIISVARHSAFSEPVRIYSVESIMMNGEITGAVLGIQFL